jgi:hypothetical protein
VTDDEDKKQAWGSRKPDDKLKECKVKQKQFVNDILKEANEKKKLSDNNRKK